MSATTTVICDIGAGGKTRVTATVKEDGRTVKAAVDTFFTEKDGIKVATQAAIDRAYNALGAMKLVTW